jgi:regulator of sigma E protease
MSWVLTIAGFAALIVLHELGHFVAAKATGMRVERFFLFFPPRVVSVRRGETEYGIGAIPLGGFVKITGMNPDEELPPEVASRGYYAQPVWKRITVIAAGPAMNLLIALVLLFGLALRSEQLTHKVGTVSQSSPAAAAGLLPGDRIVSVDGVQGGFAKLRHQIASHHCAGTPTIGCRAQTAAQVRVIRDGRQMTLRIHPEYQRTSTGRRNILGITWGTRLVPVSAGTAFDRATGGMWRVTSGTVSAIARIFEPEQRKKLSGIVGVRRRSPGGRLWRARRADAARDHQPLARGDQPLPVPAAGRRPHLLERGGEAAGPTGVVQRHRAGERGRLPAGDDPVRDRALQ